MAPKFTSITYHTADGTYYEIDADDINSAIDYLQTYLNSDDATTRFSRSQITRLRNALDDLAIVLLT